MVYTKHPNILTCSLSWPFLWRNLYFLLYINFKTFFTFNLFFICWVKKTYVPQFWVFCLFKQNYGIKQTHRKIVDSFEVWMTQRQAKARSCTHKQLGRRWTRRDSWLVVGLQFPNRPQAWDWVRTASAGSEDQILMLCPVYWRRLDFFRVWWVSGSNRALSPVPVL